MSAQPTDQIGGSTPKLSLLKSLRGSFSQGSFGSSAPTQSTQTTQTPAVAQPVVPIAQEVPAEVPPEAPPIALEQVAAEVAEDVAFDEAVATEGIPDFIPESDSLASAVPTAVDAMTDSLNPPQAGGGLAKEAPLLSVTVEHPAVDQTGGVQYVENERSPEMPPEVEGFLQKVEDNVDQIPQEVVIADLQTGQQVPRVMATPVIVLPITPQTEDEGKKKNAAYSIRWLIEWSWKMMKVFSGKVVYRDESPES